MGLFKTAAKVAVAAAAAQQAPPPPPPAHHAPPPPPPGPPAEDVMQRRIAQLSQLGELRTAGVLSDAEFEAQKAVILAS